MVTAYRRGHKIYYDGSMWRYCDDNSSADIDRPCIRCGKLPTKEGYDACLGYIDGVKSACCGHGVEKPFMSSDIQNKIRDKKDIILQKVNNTKRINGTFNSSNTEKVSKTLLIEKFGIALYIANIDEKFNIKSI